MKKVLLFLLVISMLFQKNTKAQNGQLAFKTIDANAFITTWETTSANESITIPTTGTGYNYTVDWGDGNTSTAGGNVTHSYAVAGIYTVSITGTFPRIQFNNTGDKDKIKTIEQWGNNAWTYMANAFYGCSNLTSNATDAPNLSNLTNMSNMFESATSFNQDLSSWDVSSVLNMTGMFYGATSFNQDLSSWDVSNVSTMVAMFRNATSFNQNLSAWDISKVKYMKLMFGGATSFNQDLSAWDVSSVLEMAAMFEGAILLIKI